jgi:hypothetical protein
MDMKYISTPQAPCNLTLDQQAKQLRREEMARLINAISDSLLVFGSALTLRVRQSLQG